MQPDPQPLDLIWGAKNIAQEIGKTERATYFILEKGQIPARKVGKHWCTSRSALREFFEGERA